ncbi:hypothetical protein D3C73_531660 [compost metagenome]
MANQDVSLSKDSTIYTYKLVQRINHSLYKKGLYFAVLIALCIQQVGIGNWLELLISYPLILLMHHIIAKTHFYFTGGNLLKNWSYQFGVFWNGVLPSGYSSMRLVVQTQLHILWIGILLLSGLFPWVSEAFIVNLTFLHIWIFMPRLWAFIRFRKYHKNGLMKITDKDTSCYLP